MTQPIPDGWERVVPAAPYYKLVKRDAVTVPKRRKDDGFDVDAVVLVTETSVGIAKGPGHRTEFEVDDPDATALEIAHELEDWLAEGGGPYADEELEQRLRDATGTEVSVS